MQYELARCVPLYPNFHPDTMYLVNGRLRATELWRVARSTLEFFTFSTWLLIYHIACLFHGTNRWLVPANIWGGGWPSRWSRSFQHGRGPSSGTLAEWGARGPRGSCSCGRDAAFLLSGETSGLAVNQYTKRNKYVGLLKCA